MAEATAMAPAKLYGVKDLADHFGETRARVVYALESRCISPAFIGGGHRLYEAGQLATIREALAEIEQRNVPVLRSVVERELRHIDEPETRLDPEHQTRGMEPRE